MSFITIIRIGLIMCLYLYAKNIVLEKYVNSKFTIFTNWLIYLVIIACLIGLEFYFGVTITGLIGIVAIITITILWIVNTPWSLKSANYLTNILFILYVLSIFLRWFN